MADMRMAEMWSPSDWECNDQGTGYLPYNTHQPLAPGTLMRDRYRVVSQLGKGGMGFVYLVQDENFDIQPLRSMKEMILRLDDRQHQLHLASFKREADLLETLRHPNIPRVYDSFTEYRRAYLVLDYVEGEDLKQVLDRSIGLLGPQVVGSWLIQLCTIVEYLHGHKPPIIFRDLKPSNVILTPDQRIILIDFGIAKVFTAGEKQANVGTQGYAAPEQYQGEAEIRSDIYALGAMMHHLLTKSDPRYQPPFSFHERLPSRLNPAVTPELERVIMRCLEDDPDKRYQTVTDLCAALRGALAAPDLSDTATKTDTTSLQREEARWPVLGAWVGAQLGTRRQIHARRGRPRRVPVIWALVLLSAVVLLLTGAAFDALTSSHASSHTAGRGTSGTTSGGVSLVNSSSAGSTAQQTPEGTPPPGGIVMPGTASAPGGAPTPVPTATPLPIPTATATPAPAVLSVSPTTITLSACLAVTQAHFTITNTGGMPLSWTASDNGSGYQISPGSGSIAAGGQETVTVSNILLSGNVTVSAPNAQRSPEHVTITCTA